MDALRRRVWHGSGAGVGAWAYWRVSGDRGPAVEVLTAMLDGRVVPQTVRYLADLGPSAVPATMRLRELSEAAHALWRVSGDPAAAVPPLTEITRPLLEGRYTPVMAAALRYLADIGEPAVPAAASIAHAVLDSPRRLAYFGSWRTFVEDEELRDAAAALLTPTR